MPVPAATREIVLAGAKGYWRLTLKAMCLKLTMAPGIGKFLVEAVEQIALIVGPSQPILDCGVIEALLDFLHLHVLIAEAQQYGSELDAVAILQRDRVTLDVLTIDHLLLGQHLSEHRVKKDFLLVSDLQPGMLRPLILIQNFKI